MHAGTAARYERICAVIRAYKAEHGRPPIVREIADTCGMSRGGISQLIGILANRGMIRRTQVGTRVYIDVVE